MGAWLLTSKFLGKCVVSWYQLTAEIEAFQLHLVTTTYGEAAGTVGKSECCTVVLMMVRVVWRDIRKVRVEEETAYVS